MLCGSSGRGTKNISYVKCDNRMGSYKAVNHLIECGRKNIGCIFPAVNPQQYESRLIGYKDSLYYNGIPFREEMVRPCLTDSQSIFDATVTLLKEQEPDALFCLYDYCAIFVMRAVLSMGLRIPEDIAIIGYDNIYISEFMPISLSTIDTHSAEVGRKSAELLLEMINDPDMPVRQITLKPDLIVRESTVSKKP